MRPGLSVEGARVRRLERSRERSVAAVAVGAGEQAARRSRHASEGHVSRAAERVMSEAAARRLSDDLLRPLFETSWRFWLLVLVLGTIVAAGLGTWFYQMYYGF